MFKPTLVPYTASAGGLPYIELIGVRNRHFKNKRWHWALRDASGKLMAADGLADGFGSPAKCWQHTLNAAYVLSQHAYTLPSETPARGSDMMTVNDEGYPMLRIVRTEGPP